MDRRQQKTENAIIIACCDLLKEKEYEKITVQEIIERANIGRSAFYSHFETKDVLLSKICDDLFEHIFSSTFESHIENGDYAEKQAAIIDHILYHIEYDNKDIVGILISQENNIFLHSFKKHFYEVIDQYWVMIKYNEIPVEMVKSHLYASFLGIVQIWIRDYYGMSIQQIRTYYLKLQE